MGGRSPYLMLHISKRQLGARRLLQELSPGNALCEAYSLIFMAIGSNELLECREH
jgi:hypothetical protein